MLSLPSFVDREQCSLFIKSLLLALMNSRGWVSEAEEVMCSSVVHQLCGWVQARPASEQPALPVTWPIGPARWFSNLVYSIGTLSLCKISDVSPEKSQQFPLPSDGLESSQPLPSKIRFLLVIKSHLSISGPRRIEKHGLNSESLCLRNRT